MMALGTPGFAFPYSPTCRPHRFPRLLKMWVARRLERKGFVQSICGGRLNATVNLQLTDMLGVTHQNKLPTRPDLIVGPRYVVNDGKRHYPKGAVAVWSKKT